MILITGATGFIGKALAAELHKRELRFAPVSRQTKNETAGNSIGDAVLIPTLDGATNWSSALRDVHTVIHLAGRAHILKDTTKNPFEEFVKTNVFGSVNLAKQAATAGVRRFIFISSIGVNGNTTSTSFTELSEPCPVGPYAISKLDAEIELSKFIATTAMELVTIRPPLVYGANAPGNFARLMSLSAKGLPLPLGAINNKRSLLYVKNLVDFLILCTNHPKAANQTFLLSDGEDVSTTQLLKMLAKAQGAPSRLLPVSSNLLTRAMRLLGKDDIAQRLLGNLQIDSSKARKLLGWTPPFSFEAGIHDMFQT